MTRTRRPAERTDPWLIVTAILAAVLVVLLAVAGIVLLGGGSGDASPTPGVTASTSPSGPSASSQPSGGASSEPSTGASAQPSPAATPSVEPSAGASPSPTVAASPDSSACTGSDDNRAFFSKAAEALTFEVYCAALPTGWTVVDGSYSGRSGGRLEIAYRGPKGATLRLREGPAACTDDPACPPTGSDLGAASFGDQPGSLLGEPDGFAIVASQLPLLYIAQTTGLDQAASVALAGALIPIP